MIFFYKNKSRIEHTESAKYSFNKRFIILGCDAAENILKRATGDVISQKTSQSMDEDHKSYVQNVREQIFSKFFKLRHQIPIAHEGQHLNRYRK